MAAVTKVAPERKQQANKPAGATRRALRRNLSGWLFASPWILGFLLWTVGPMAASLLIAFTDWDLLTTPEFVGAQNFAVMFAGLRRPFEPISRRARITIPRLPSFAVGRNVGRRR